MKAPHSTASFLPVSPRTSSIGGSITEFTRMRTYVMKTATVRRILLFAAAVFAWGFVLQTHAQISVEAADGYDEVLRRVNNREGRKTVESGTVLIHGHPQLLRVYRHVADGFVMYGAVAEGVRFFDSLRNMEAHRAGSHYGLSRLRASGGDREGAEFELKNCVRLRPDFHDACMRLANHPESGDHIGKIDAWMERRVESGTPTAALYMGIGILKMRVKDFEASEAAMRRSLELDPDAPIAFYHLGLLQTTTRKHGDAAETYSRGAEAAKRLNDREFESVLTGLTGAALSELQRHGEAIKHKEAASLLARELGDRRLEMFHTGNLGNSLKAVGRLEEALDKHDKALVLAVELSESEFQETTLGNKAATLSDLNRFDEAVVCGRQALALAAETGDSAAVAGHSANIGVAFVRRAEYDAALDNFNRALNIHRNEGNVSEECRVLAYIGGALNSLGRNLKAVGILEPALETASRNGEPASLIPLLTALGNSYAGLGRYSRADSCFRLALRLAESSGDHASSGLHLGNIGLIEKIRGRLDTAEEFLSRALQRDLERRDLRGVIRHLNNMANIRQIRGDFSGALQLQERALQYSDSVGSVDLTAIVLQNIGTSHDKLGDAARALHYYHEAWKAAEKIGATSSLIAILRSIGIMHERFGEDSCALDAYEEAYCLAVEGGHMVDAASSLTAIGVVHMRRKESRKALELFAGAWQEYLQAEDMSDMGNLLVHMGEAMRDLKEYELSCMLLEEAESMAHILGDPIMAHNVYVRMGDIKRWLNSCDEAVRYYDRAARQLESVRKSLLLPSERTSFFDRHMDAFELLVLASLDAGTPAEAYRHLQRFRALSARETLGALRDNVRADLPDDKIGRLHSLELLMREIYSQLSTRELRSDPALRLGAERELQRLLDRHSEMLASLERRHPRWSKATSAGEPPDIDKVQRLIPEGAALVEYFISREKSAAWIIRKDSSFLVPLRATSGELEKKISILRQPFIDIRDGRIRNLADLHFDASVAKDLHSDLISPLEKHLRPETPLIIVPDGVLHFLPFEMLVTDIESRPIEKGIIFSEYESLRFLIERYPVSYLPGAALLDLSVTKGERKPVGESVLLGIGAPHFGLHKEGEISSSGAATERHLLAGGGNDRFKELKSSDLFDVASIVRTDLLLGRDATETRFKYLAGEYSHLYISSHAVADEQRPNYSFIVLAQDSARRDDGFLYAYEVYNLGLNAELVTLSACETGLGRLSRGEGIVSLTRAFLCAGASSLLMSLWAVDERATRLMPLFYSRLRQGLSRNDALRSAKLELMLKRENGISFSHPFLWAAFVLTGSAGR